MPMDFYASYETSRGPRAAVAFVAMWTSVICSTARADVIELKTGQKIEGAFLKESGGELIVDLGVDVVRVPVSPIKSRQASGEPGKVSDEARPEKHEIYSTSELPF